MRKQTAVFIGGLVVIAILGIGGGVLLAYLSGSDDRAESKSIRAEASAAASSAAHDAELIDAYYARQAAAESLCKDAVAAEGFKDPASLMFRNLRPTQGDDPQSWDLAGEVNGKNSLGAYVGYRPFDCQVRPDGTGQMSATHVFVYSQ